MSSTRHSTDQNHYTTNFLSHVIFRIDFSIILDLVDNLPREFQNKILNSYPILEPIQQFLVKIENNGSNINTIPKNKTTWRFKTNDDDHFVELDSEFLTIVSKKYTNFTSFKKNLSQILSVFLETYPNVVIKRLGLRYINQIHLEDTDYFHWHNYINETLIKNIDFIEDKNTLRRLMQIYEIKPEEDTHLTLKCGIFNSSYPAQISKNEFTLDYDCYSQVEIFASEILNRLSKFNEIITIYFEKSITDAFRKKLNRG